MPIVQLKHVRLSFPDVFKPGKPMNPGDTPKFGAQLIIEKGSENEKAVKAAMATAAKETYGENWAAIVGAMEKSKKCLRDGNTNLDSAGNIRDGYKDMSYVSARNKAKPAVVDARRDSSGQWVPLTEADGKIYGGCIVNAKIEVLAMKGKEKVPNNIYASLQAIQYVSKGKAFGAAPGTPEGFDDEDVEDDGFGGNETSSDTSNGDDPFA